MKHQHGDPLEGATLLRLDQAGQEPTPSSSSPEALSPERLALIVARLHQGYYRRAEVIDLLAARVRSHLL